MFLDALRITPEIRLARPSATPGSLIEGTLYITATAKEPVTVKEIWVELSGSAELNGNVTHYSAVPNEAAPVPGTSSPSFQNVPESCRVSVALAKTRVCVRAEASQFSAGVHAVPFAIPVPLDCDGAPLPPSFDAPRLGLCARYAVAGSLKLAPLVSRNDRQPLKIVSPAPLAAPAPSAAQRLLRVQTWEKASTRLWPRLRYYLGANTSAHESEVLLNVALQDINLGPNAVAYIQDSLRLAVTPSHSAVTQQLLVDCVRVELYSEVMHRRDSASSARYTVFRARNIDFPVDFDATTHEADITAVLSGARVPDTVAPSLLLRRIDVQHWLYVRVGLRSASPDGTRQAVAHTKLEMPVRITFADREQSLLP